MGVVGSLPVLSSPTPPTLDDTTKISHEESISSTDNCSCSDMMINDMDSNTNSSSNSSINKDNISDDHNNSKSTSPTTLAYGPINIKVRRFAAPTLATGRRSKFVKLEGDAAIKREIRRKRNREAAQKLKEKRMIIEEQFNKQISELEFKGQELLTSIEDLRTYKGYLESQYQQLMSIQKKVPLSTPSTLKQVEHNRRRVHQNIPIHRDIVNMKKEPRSPSPQWQLLFSI
jgi:hypothetical protein